MLSRCIIATGLLAVCVNCAFRVSKDGYIWWIYDSRFPDSPFVSIGVNAWAYADPPEFRSFGECPDPVLPPNPAPCGCANPPSMIPYTDFANASPAYSTGSLPQFNSTEWICKNLVNVTEQMNMNTLGGWSDLSWVSFASQMPKLCEHEFGVRLRRVPYFTTVMSIGGSFPTQINGFPDVFDAGWQSHVADECAGLSVYAGNDYFLGYFTDHELPWPTGSTICDSYMMHALSRPEYNGSYATPLLSLYQRYGGNITALEADWGLLKWRDKDGKRLLKASSLQPAVDAFHEELRNVMLIINSKVCNAFPKHWTFGLGAQDAVQHELSTIMALYPHSDALLAHLEDDAQSTAQAYFKPIRTFCSDVAPGALNLAVRFINDRTYKNVLRGSLDSTNHYTPLVDVHSFNLYARNPFNVVGGSLDEYYTFVVDSKIPFMISEFSFSAMESLNPNNVPCPSGWDIRLNTQAQRAGCYQGFTMYHFDKPYAVGAHWFQYIDQPELGRCRDGANYNFGTATVSDQPWITLRSNMRSANGMAPLVHEQLIPPFENIDANYETCWGENGTFPFPYNACPSWEGA